MAYFPRRYYSDYAVPPQPSGLSYAPYRPQYPSLPMDSGYPLTGPVYRTEHPPVDTTPRPSNQNTANTLTPSTTNTKADQGDPVINKRYKYYGYALLLLSVAILGLEVANVVFTCVKFEVNTSTYITKSFAAPYILTWIAPGIWGAIPVFITGRLAISVAGKNNKLVRVFALFCSLSAAVFTPAIIAISVAEIVMYPNNTPSTDKRPSFAGSPCYTFDNAGSLSCPKFLLPLIIAVLGAIAFFLTLMVTIVFCYYFEPPNDETSEPETTEVIDEYYPYGRYPPYSPVKSSLMRLPVTQPYSMQAPIYRAAPRMVEPDMDFLRSYPVYRPAASRGFGFAPAYNRQSYGNFPGTLPSLTSFGNPEANPAYRVVYG